MTLDPIFHKDIIDSIEEMKELMPNFKDKTFFVTGATGLVGYQFIMTLVYMNEYFKTNCKIIGHARNKEKFDALYEEYQNQGILGVFQDITEPIHFDGTVDYVLHTAATTQSKLIINNPAKTFYDMIDGTRAVLEFTKEKGAKVIFTSSMEAYGRYDEFTEVTEKDLGYLDVTNPRNVYPEGKRASEMIAFAYGKEASLDVIVARLAQTFGSGVSTLENRFFAQLAKNVINGQDIVLKTDGESVANYCDIRDVVQAFMYLFVKGERNNIYNISNPKSTMRIKEVASLVAERITGNQIQVVYEIEDLQKSGFAEKTQIKLNVDKIVKLGWKPQRSLEASFHSLIDSFKEREEGIQA
ncbi:NAD(P)-dependent oxidoreductase [Enterococcus sp. BWM-S5]|uniref:NAD(P)-dependent oxidoreductase n=1 Tax=Enterococcus larvae TaxID=2794352 RepID=A0ABS4CI92_9ENTE|nr:NAD(P)-dependent oxidoreductase [Enterococcus larvae]MBP1046353.1 NAD(P)-dependent oxidoreductase [Enterococcus larvae]